MGELGTYKPFDYPRLCDVCGVRRRISKMTKHPGGVWVCDSHPDERTAFELSKLKTRVYNIIPVPNPKPESQYPDVMEAEDAIIMNFAARMTAAGTRYEAVISGQAPLAGHMLDGLSWAARYLYAVITDTSTPARVLAQAKAQLLSIATQLRARQQGFGISTSSTKTNDAFWGGFLESGDSRWYSENAATAGLALLYAYRVFGSAIWIVSARAAASFLRNVQAIGSNGTHFTSSDSAGTARLYTGGLTSYVANVSGVYSDHCFYPSSLLSLHFWNELKATDGDQQIGSDGTPTGFDSVPQQFLSRSITDLRTFWANGVQDAVLATYTGLSSTTPREFFNAYPATKPGTTVVGTGRWEYEDGGATTGTLISSLNFAKALASLYAYEGASTQVTTIDDWMRSFTSNADFETPGNTSPRDLARSTTGDYDATVCPSTLLLVRNADDNYAAIAENGSSLYDWGAFGLLSPLWSARHGGTFPDARQSVFGVVQRFDDGARSDGDYEDWISLRGLSGLSYQTAFAVDSNGNPSPAGAGTPVTTPPTVGLVFWVKGDAGLLATGGIATTWADQSGYGQDVTDLPGNPGPFVGLDSINGIPCVSWSTDGGHGATPLRGLFRSAGLRDRNGSPFGYGTGETQARTIMTVLIPRYSSTAFDITGGIVCEMGSTPAWQPLFDLEPNFGNARGFYLFAAGTWRGAANAGPDTVGGVSGVYNGATVLAEWSSTGFDNLGARLNGTVTTITPSTIGGSTGPTLNPQFSLGRQSSGGFNFFGAMSEMLIWDHAIDDDERAQATTYMSGRYSSLGNQALMVNDLARASMFGLALRQTPTATVIPS